MSSSGESETVRVVGLRTDYEAEPTNVPVDGVRFGWRIEADRRDVRQTAYRIRVVRSGDSLDGSDGLVWDSGQVETPRATSIDYDGPWLASDTTYQWSVRVWDAGGEATDWAEPATFATALDGPGDWAGEWIGYQPDGGDSSGYRSRWGTGETEWVQLDIGESAALERIDLCPTAPIDALRTPDGFPVTAQHAAADDAGRFNGATGFGFPRRYRIEVCDDLDDGSWEPVVDRTDADQSNPGQEIVSHEVAGRGRYVRLTATTPYRFDPADPPGRSPGYKPELLKEDYDAWTVLALAGVRIVDDTGTDRAAGATVTASSSVESEAWGRAKLVDGHIESTLAGTAPLLRTEFDLDRPVARGRLHVGTLGYGECYVNGQRIGEAVLDPGWTDSDDRALTTTHEIGDALDVGTNALGLWLGGGWYGKHAGHWASRGSPRAIVHLTVEFEDGTTETIRSEPSWRADASPIRSNDLFDGERYDARLEQPGWAEPGFDDEEWADATVVAPPGGALAPQRTPPIRVTDTVEPISIRTHEDGQIVDFGQNVVGWVELTIDGGETGDEIGIAHAETRVEDGSLNTVDLRSADATDTYIAAGEGVETYEPRFTYHGFRYAQVRGYPGTLDHDDVVAKVVHTDLEQTGSFACSNDDLVRVQQNAEWGLRGNSHSIPTDCPQRDERLGWTGDAHIAARALLYNFDAVRFHEKWLADHVAQQSPHGYIADTLPFGFGTVPEDRTWGITMITIPWHLYRHAGDISILEAHYESMRAYVEYWHGESEAGYIDVAYTNYGDWLAHESVEDEDRYRELLATAFHYHTVALFARIADVLDNEGDAARYERLAAETKATFTEAFLDEETGSYGPGTQTANAVPLYVGLVPDALEQRVAETLADRVRADGSRLMTGFLGTRPLVHVLAEHGHAELAYEVVSQSDCPGWVYMVRQGATTMWERWDSDQNVGEGMNSFNHSPFTFVSEWFYSVLAGIEFGDSVRDLEIAPNVSGHLRWVSGAIETVNGSVTSRWERTSTGLDLSVTIPENATATVWVPMLGAEAVTLSEGQTRLWERDVVTVEQPGIHDVTRRPDAIEVAVGSGTYAFHLESTDP